MIKKIELEDKVDSRLPLNENKGAKIGRGKRVIAMILNGLGFIDDRLYMFPQFLENKPIDRLFSSDITADYFNDDALGRCLDAIHDYGSTLLFSEIAFEIATQYGLLGKTAHIDSTKGFESRLQ